MTNDIDQVLGIDPTDPIQMNAEQLVEADEALLDDLVALRKRLGLTQQDVADRLSVAVSAIARIESGERDPHLSTLRRYSLALGAKVTHQVEPFESISRVWFYKPGKYGFSWKPWLISCDEHCRKTLKLGWSFTGSICIAIGRPEHELGCEHLPWPRTPE